MRLVKSITAIVLFLVAAAVAIWFALTTQEGGFIKAMMWFLAVLLPLIALTWAVKFFQSLRDVAGAVVALTDDALVYPKGLGEASILFTDMKGVALHQTVYAPTTQAGPAFGKADITYDVIVEKVDGNRVTVFEGNQYGDPQTIVNAIQSRIPGDQVSKSSGSSTTPIVGSV